VSDYITAQDNETGEDRHIQVVQIWIDPKHPEAHRDPALRRYVERRANEGTAALVRFDERKATVLFAPAFSVDGQWHEIDTGISEQQHEIEDVVRALGAPPTMVISDT
jgi:hypothetical protein